MSYMIWPVVVLNFSLLFGGFTLLILSGDKLVETSVRIARWWNIPASVIAVTIIAAGTSAPELVTSFIAGFRGNSDISIGNVMGSNIFNILAVGGLSLCFQAQGNLRGTFPGWLVLIFASVLFYFSIHNLELNRIEALVFIGTLIAFLFFSFFQERDKASDFENLDSTSRFRTSLFFVLALLGLVLGAELALQGGVALGKMAGLSERVIAITIISAGTGLPELATSIAAAFRGHSDIAIANVIGSNIFNTLAIPGATASFFALKVSPEFLTFDFYVMLGATLIVGLLYLINNPKLRRSFGFLMFIGYSAYTLHLIF